MKFQIRKAKDGSFYYALVGKNGEDMMISEMMTQKHSCIDSINSILQAYKAGDILLEDTTK